jgi:hypothetical protein
MGYPTTRACGPGRGRAGGSSRPPGAGRACRGQPSPARVWEQIRIRRGGQLPRRTQRESPAPGRPLSLLPGPDRGPGRGRIRGAVPGRNGLPASFCGDRPRASHPRQGLPAGRPRDGPRTSSSRNGIPASHPRNRPPASHPRHGIPAGRPRDGPRASYPRHGLSASFRGDRIAARGRTAETWTRRGQRARPRRHPARVGAGHVQGRSAVTGERVAASGTAARPGDPGSTGERFRQRGITASGVTVERRCLPDRGPRRTRPGARIPARTGSARPGVPAGPVLAVERA